MSQTTPQPADEAATAAPQPPAGLWSGRANPEVPRISRAKVVGRFTELYDDARYLEVGVCEGVTFHKVPAARKVAVDPAFRFDHAEQHRQNPSATYHEVTSDEYFARIIEPEEKFDVIYLDGLHVFEQTLRDLMNALNHLQPKGVIVVDDTHPPTHLASFNDRAEFFKVRRWLGSTDSRWMGDVFRLVWFVDTFMPHLSYRTVSNNHGQTVFWRTRRTDIVERRVEEVARISFEELVLDEATLRLARYRDIRREVRADLGI